MIPAIGSMVFALVVVVCLYVLVRCAELLAAQESAAKPNRLVQLLAVLAILGALLGSLASYSEWSDMKHAAETASGL